MADIDFVPVPLLGIVVLLEGDARTHDAGTGLQGVAGYIEHVIGVVKGVFHQRLHGIHHGLNLPQASENHVFGIFQRKFRPGFSSAERVVPHVEIVRQADNEQDNNGDGNFAKLFLCKTVFVVIVLHKRGRLTGNRGFNQKLL